MAAARKVSAGGRGGRRQGRNLGKDDEDEFAESVSDKYDSDEAD